MKNNNRKKGPFYVRARLTPRRIEVLRTIFKLIQKRRFPSPSMQEIADKMAMPDRQSVHNHLLVLRHMNMVNWQEHKARTLQITEAGLSVLGKEADAVPQG